MTTGCAKTERENVRKKIKPNFGKYTWLGMAAGNECLELMFQTLLERKQKNIL